MKGSLSRKAALIGAGALLASRTRSEEPMTHIALLGDSVIDNKAYVGGAPDVAEQLRMVAPKEWKVTKLAVDGAVTSGVMRQLSELPRDITHLIISAGGNDALQHSGILDAPATSAADVLLKLAEIQDQFRQGYGRMLDMAQRLNLPTAVCTVYDPRFPEPVRRRLGALALAVINDAITREAFSRHLNLLDLRTMFNDDRDFANAIEPSAQGGMKLARGIYGFVSGEGGPRVIPA
jgi:hypothetical protein